MSKQADRRFEIRRLPAERIPTIELIPVLALRNPMHGLLEVDVTAARRRIHEHLERTGQKLSFTAFLIACLAGAVEEHREVQAFRRGRNLIVFEDVDVSTLVEVEAAGARVPVPHVVRDAARKSVKTIHDELRAAKTDGTLVAGLQRRMGPLRWVPKPLRWLLWHALARSPRAFKHYGGTVVLTSVGMFGAGRGWGSGLVSYPVTVTVGGLSSQPALRDGELSSREQLCLTVSLDHEAVDGAPAARFVARLRTLIEEGHGLPRSAVTERVAQR